MYDFLLLTPHAHASHSLMCYLNQHQHFHVAMFSSISRSLADIGAYERHMKPWLKSVGVSTKEYDKPEMVDALLAATKKALLIQVVRDPIACFIAQVRTQQFYTAFHAAMGKPFTPVPIEERIGDAIQRYVTPAFAEDAFHATSFERHLLVDVDELRDPLTTETVKRIWREIGNDDQVQGATFEPLGSRDFMAVRSFARTTLSFNQHNLPVVARLENDLTSGYFDANAGQFVSTEARICTFPNARDVIPSIEREIPLHLYTLPSTWYAFHPSIRPAMARSIGEAVIPHFQKFSAALAQGKAALAFAVEDLTAVQADLLRFGIGDDFEKFQSRHPDIASRWTETIKFLGG